MQYNNIFSGKNKQTMVLEEEIYRPIYNIRYI